MPEYNSGLDDEPLSDASVPISGIDNSQPPSAIGKTLAATAENRLTSMDGLNRPRPGTIERFNTTSSFDSIHHLGGGQFLWNSANVWGKYDSRSNVNTALSGGPVFASGDQVYSALADTVLYFSRGQILYKYSIAGGFGTNTIPSQWPDASYPLWAFSRLIYVNKNNLVISDILDPEVWDPATQELTLDPIASDVITGIIMWQRQTLAVFRNGSTWIVETGPNLDVVDWTLNRASSTVGCCCHGTIAQCGSEVFFLSETGRGVYALSQMPTSDQTGIWKPISEPIRRYIDRINWSAIKNARATYWNDLYMLSVPLDGATYNNYILCYSISMGTWQGQWCFEISGADHGFRDSARDRTNPDETMLLIGNTNGVISEFTYPSERKYYSLSIGGVKTPYYSQLTSRAFTFTNDVNLIEPHKALIQFLESEDTVDVTIWADRTIQLRRIDTATNIYKLTLPIPGFPFDLDKEGYYLLPISLSYLGVCSELQIELEGEGNWTLFQIKATAFTHAPLISI
jgi:hypothetical protein